MYVRMKKNRYGLTKKQMKVMAMYNKYFEKNWHPPTFEYMAQKLWITAPWAFFHIKNIRGKWLIAEIDTNLPKDRSILDRIESKLDTILSIINPSEWVFTAQQNEWTFNS